MGKFKPIRIKPRAMLDYGVAFLSVGAALLVAQLHFQLQAAPVSLFLCAIMFSAWIGGLKAGVLATVLSVLSFTYYFLAPIHSFAVDPAEIPRLVVFLLAAVFVLAISGAQKQSEEKLRNTARELETNIEDLKRTQHDRQQAEEALRQAQAELAHMTRLTTMGELTASIAHEVNQPLTAVVNNANACISLLDSAPRPHDENGPATPKHPREGATGVASNLEEVREALTEIIDDADRASAVILRIRQLAKRAAIERSVVDLRDIVKDVLVLARYESTARGVSIRVDLPQDLPFVSGDRVQLQQVLLNLVMNAMDAMKSVEESNRILIINGRREIRDEASEAWLSVQDAGIGFKPEEIERLFEAFYTTKPDGMGMGLAISRSIIQAHGGRLWAETNQGPGATFLFSLPTAPEISGQGQPAALDPLAKSGLAADPKS
jgi:signal transduction histidine kinase